MPNWKKILTSGSDASLNILTVTNGITGSLLGTASYASQALSASFATTASYVLQAVSASFATTSTTQTAGNSTTAVATTAFVTTADNLKANLATPTFTTNITTPLIIGGTAVGSTLTYKTTTGIGTTDAHIFQVGNNGATEAMRILNSGNIGIGTALFPTISSLSVSKNMTGGTAVLGIESEGVIQSDATLMGRYFTSYASTAATAFTVANLMHFSAYQSTIGAGSAVTNQQGFFVDASLTGATNNYGFRGAIASGTNRYNVYMDGTAQNYFAGNVGIGTAAPTEKLHVVNTDGAIVNIYSTGNVVPTSGGSQNVFDTTTTPASDISRYFNTTIVLRNAGTQSITSATQGAHALGVFAYNNATAGTLTNFTGQNFDLRNQSTGVITNLNGIKHETATNTGTVTNYYAHRILAQTIGSTLCVGYGSEIAAGTGRYNTYMVGTAQNYFAGNVGIGNSTPTAVLHLKSGSATANTSPLKFTSGATMSIAEAGSVEFLTDAYYGTITTGAARKTFAFLESPTFTGTPTLPTGTIATTQASNTNNTTLATTAYADANQIFSATASLSSAQIKALFTTPIQIVANPGSGKYIEVISATSEMTFATAAYTTNTTLQIISSGSNVAQVEDPVALLSTVSRNSKFVDITIGTGATTETQILSNVNLVVKAKTGNPGVGAGTAKIKLLYRIVTI